MIRARKEDGGGFGSHSVQRERMPLNPLQQQQHVAAVSHSINTSTATSNSSSISSVVGSSNPNTPKSRNALSVSSSSAFVALSASSMQLYNNLKQHHHHGTCTNNATSSTTITRRKSKSTLPHANLWGRGNGSSGIWTVQIPKRMLFSTLGVFLILPLLIFVWKETHLQPADPSNGDQLRGSNGNAVQLKEKNRFVTWMEDNLPEDLYNETDGSDGDGGVGGGAIFLPEPITLLRNGKSIRKGSNKRGSNGIQNQTRTVGSITDDDDDDSSSNKTRSEDQYEEHLREMDEQEDDLDTIVLALDVGTAKKVDTAAAKAITAKELFDDSARDKQGVVLGPLSLVEKRRNEGSGADLKSAKQEAKELKVLIAKLENIKNEKVYDQGVTPKNDDDKSES